MGVIDINVKQNKKIGLMFALLAALAATLGVVVYIQKIKHNKSERELNEIDRELKQLQLAEIKKKNGNQ
jgi:CHASE3 domain sensor protein